MTHFPRFRLSAPGLIASAAIAALSACSSVPPGNAVLEQARSDYRAAQDAPQTRQYAAAELSQAGTALTLANEAATRRDEPAQVTHLAYLAKQQTALAQAVARQRAAEQRVAAANAQRDQQRLGARTREADASRADAHAARLEASDSQARNAELEAQLRDMNARQSERGLVITIGDLLFDTNRAAIKPEGLRGVEKLADFMKRHPERHVMVEGFTDNVGSEAANLRLSRLRAEAVRDALLAQGIGGERVVVRGYGEGHPVASDDSAQGRQLNRRVEIVVSRDASAIAPR